TEPRSHTRRTQPHTTGRTQPQKTSRRRRLLQLDATASSSSPPPPDLRATIRAVPAVCAVTVRAVPPSAPAPSPPSPSARPRRRCPRRPRRPLPSAPSPSSAALRAAIPCPPRHRPLPCRGDGARDSGSRAVGCCGDGAREPPAGCCGDTAPSREPCCRACSRCSREDELHVPCLVCFRNVEVLDGSCGNIKFDGLVVDENPSGSAASNDGPTPGAEVILPLTWDVICSDPTSLLSDLWL
ncbi:unnamed protein product, partial [Urochloa humidicola]